MSRPKLITPETPLLMRLCLYPYQWAASLSLAVTLLTVMAATFGFGTFVESFYGTPTAQFFIFQTWWFNLLGVMLAINIACAALIRFPWKRHQTGFVITHIGLLTMLFGLTMSRMTGIDAQMTIFEHQDGHWAFERNTFFEIAIRDKTVEQTDEDSNGETVNPVTIHHIPFHPGTFNWSDYTVIDWKKFHPSWWSIDPLESSDFDLKAFSVFAFANRHDRGDVLFDEDGVKVELVDFYADSRRVKAPQIKLKMTAPPQMMERMTGRSDAGEVFVPFTLSVSKPVDEKTYPEGIPDRTKAGGGSLMFSMSGSPEQTYGFLHGGPKGDLGEKGQVVIHSDSTVTRVDVAEKVNEGRFPLEDGKLEAEIASYFNRGMLHSDPVTGRFTIIPDDRAEEPTSPTVVVKVYDGEKKVGEMILSAVQPEVNIYDYEANIFGEYWYDYSEMEREERERLDISSRVEVIQSDDYSKLYYRIWDLTKVTGQDELYVTSNEDDAVDALETKAATLRMYVEEFVSSPEPENVVVPLEFEREKMQVIPAAKVRLTVDDKSELIWVRQYLGAPDDQEAKQRMTESLASEDTEVSLVMPREAVDVGFRVRLIDFERKLDPGSGQAAHFSSLVDFEDLDKKRLIYSEPIHNAADGQTGKGIFAETEGEQSANSLDLPDFRNATAIACDSENSTLFWIDPKHLAIRSFEKDAEAITTLVSNPSENSTEKPAFNKPLAIAIDPVNQIVYWTDHETSQAINEDFGVVRRCRYDGSPLADESSPMADNSIINRDYPHKAIVATSSPIHALVIDHLGEKIYWQQRRSRSISRANLDGSDPEPDYIIEAGFVGGLAISPDGYSLVWTETEEQDIFTFDLKGDSGKKILCKGGEKNVIPEHIACSNDRVFWTLRDTAGLRKSPNSEKPLPRRNAIWSSDLEKGKPVSFIPTAVRDAGGLAIDTESGSAYWTQSSVFRSDLWITMNAPQDVVDPKTGRSYRMFQESLAGPFRPGSAEFEELAPPDSPIEELYNSTLTVNYDRGRGIRNIGCLLVIFGIATMFYMRAYFFKKPARRATETIETTAVSEETKPKKKSKNKKGDARKPKVLS